MTLRPMVAAVVVSSMLVFIGCCPPGPTDSGSSSSTSPSQSSVSSAQLVGTWRQQLNAPGAYDELILGGDGTVRHTVHMGGGMADIVEAGGWKLSGDTLQLSFEGEDASHPALMKGLGLSGGQLTAADNCVWMNGEYFCSGQAITYTKQ